jgi:hypothetical protein
MAAMHPCALQHSRQPFRIVQTRTEVKTPKSTGLRPLCFRFRQFRANAALGCHLSDTRGQPSTRQLTLTMALTTASRFLWLSAATQMRPESTP